MLFLDNTERTIKDFLPKVVTTMKHHVGLGFMRDSFVLSKGNIWNNEQYLIPLAAKTAALFVLEDSTMVGQALLDNTQLQPLVRQLNANAIVEAKKTPLSEQCFGVPYAIPPNN